MPGHFDLQVNGYAGVDFNAEDVTPQQFRAACAALRAAGTQSILATIITDDLDRMAARLNRIVAARDSDPLVADVIAGIHIEGPFLNPTPGFVGAHPATAIRPADVDAMRTLLGAAAGLTRLVTLAPECDPQLRVTKLLTAAGVAVSAGHTDASLDQLRAAIDAGLTLFTHLGNGCPLTLPRHDNIIQRIFSLRGKLWVTFIADGAHVPMFVLGNMLRSVGLDRAIIVSDAMAAAGLGPGTYTLGHRTVQIAADGVARTPEGYLAGSAAGLQRAAENLQRELSLTDAEIQRLMITNPRSAVELE